MELRRPLPLTWAATVAMTTTLGGCDRSPRAPADVDSGGAGAVARAAPKHSVILFVWDGLRPDAITREDTPVLFDLATRGTWFQRHHATYPTFTMSNAASFATGASPGTHAFFGNTIYVVEHPPAPGEDSSGRAIAWQQPVFTEDGALLRQLDAHYRLTDSAGRGLLHAETLFHVAHARGLRTAAVGKVGPVDLMDMGREGLVVSERAVWPLPAAREIQRRFGLPPSAERAFDARSLEPSDGGNPTAEAPRRYLGDGVTSEPLSPATGAPAGVEVGTPYRRGNDWLMRIMVEYVLPVERPDLVVLWLRDPDSTEHVYGPGTADVHAALRTNDAYLGQLEDALRALGIEDTTDLIVASDHAHSTVSGPTSVFPLRPLTDERPRDVDRSRVDPGGFSVSGDVRLADLMHRARPPFAAYDGSDCVRDPVLSGIDRAGKSVYDGASCTTAGRPVPEAQGRLAADAIVIANNGGTEYLYVPSKDPNLVLRAVRFLQSRPEVGAVFVAGHDLPGTLSLQAIGLDDPSGRAPDIVLSYAWDDQAAVSGARGIEFASMRANSLRGMHGSFSPVDVHCVMVARGPSFRPAFGDDRPSGNMDVAPTIAHLLGLDLPAARGRCLAEALRDGCGGVEAAPQAAREVLSPGEPAANIDIASVTSPDGRAAAPGRSFTFQLVTERLFQGGKTYVYYDEAGRKRP